MQKCNVMHRLINHQKQEPVVHMWVKALGQVDLCPNIMVGNGGHLFQPWYSKRAIALHQHDTVTGQPIGHGCVRMDEPNAKRIYDFSVIGYTQVEISGRASPVECSEEQKCDAAKSKTTKDEGSVTESKEGKKSIKVKRTKAC
jgi:hypothetical protein